MARGRCPPFDLAGLRAGHMTPVSSAARSTISACASCCAHRRPRAAAARAGAAAAMRSARAEVSGFVFKVQANMDPEHRDRIAFLRVCSGRSSAA